MFVLIEKKKAYFYAHYLSGIDAFNTENDKQQQQQIFSTI